MSEILATRRREVNNLEEDFREGKDRLVWLLLATKTCRSQQLPPHAEGSLVLETCRNLKRLLSFASEFSQQPMQPLRNYASPEIRKDYLPEPRPRRADPRLFRDLFARFETNWKSRRCILTRIASDAFGGHTPLLALIDDDLACRSRESIRDADPGLSSIHIDMSPSTTSSDLGLQQTTLKGILALQFVQDLLDGVHAWIIADEGADASDLSKIFSEWTLIFL